MISLFFDIAHLTALFLATASPQHTKSTCYGYPGDRYAGGKTIWWQAHPRNVSGVAMRRPLTAKERRAGYVENYGARLGDFVIIENPRNGLRAVLRVGDRGPFWWVPAGVPAKHGYIRTTKPHRSEKGRYASNVDITWPACKALKHRGLQYVRLYRIPRRSALGRALIEKHGCNPKNPPRWWKVRKCGKRKPKKAATQSAGIFSWCRTGHRKPKLPRARVIPIRRTTLRRDFGRKNNGIQA